MNKRARIRMVVALIVAGTIMFLIGYVFGWQSSQDYFLKMDAKDRRTLNDGFTLVGQNTTGRVETLGICWTEESNGVIRIVAPGKLGHTILEIDQEGKYVGGETWEGP